MRWKLLRRRFTASAPRVTVRGHLPWPLRWLTAAGSNQPLQVKQYARVEGMLDCPPQAVVKSAQVKVTDASGAVRALQTLKL